MSILEKWGQIDTEKDSSFNYEIPQELRNQVVVELIPELTNESRTELNFVVKKAWNSEASSC